MAQLRLWDIFQWSMYWVRHLQTKAKLSLKVQYLSRLNNWVSFGPPPGWRLISNCFRDTTRLMIILRLLAGGTAASSNCWSDNQAVGPVASMQSRYNADVPPRLKTILFWISQATAWSWLRNMREKMSSWSKIIGVILGIVLLFKGLYLQRDNSLRQL